MKYEKRLHYNNNAYLLICPETGVDAGVVDGVDGLVGGDTGLLFLLQQ